MSQRVLIPFPRLVTTQAQYHPKCFLHDASFILGQEGSPTPGGEVQVSWGLIHNCGANREGDRQTGWSSICGDADTEPISHRVCGFARQSASLFSPVVKSFES